MEALSPPEIALFVLEAKNGSILATPRRGSLVADTVGQYQMWCSGRHHMLGQCWAAHSTIHEISTAHRIATYARLVPEST
eukprot:3591165-Rhodomonas_salina.1